MHYLSAGAGDPVVLLHGYAETSHMWRPLMAELAQTHTVIAPDLRGAGQSSTPAGGYTKAEMAQDIHALVHKLGYERIRIVGHDIGLMVAYAYAAQYPSEVDRIVLMDAFLPGVGKWRDVWLMRDLWHFHFYGKTPLALVHGRERIYFEHFWNDFAANPRHSVPERDRRIYAKAYARPGGMRAGFEYFRAFEKDAEDFARSARTPLPMPMLVLTGEKASGEFLIQQGRLVAANVEGVVVRVPATGSSTLKGADRLCLAGLWGTAQGSAGSGGGESEGCTWAAQSKGRRGRRAQSARQDPAALPGSATCTI